MKFFKPIALGILTGIASLLIGYSIGLSATYYVDCNADGDDGAGTGTGAAVAWKTIAKVNASSFSAGDNIYFNKGCTWRETLTIPSDGSSGAGNVITFGAYGTGANPIIKATNSPTFTAKITPSLLLPRMDLKRGMLI